MNKTPKTLRGSALKMLRSTCPCSNVIELADGTTVCIRCEKVSAK